MIANPGDRLLKIREALGLVKSQIFWYQSQDMSNIITPFVQVITSLEQNLPSLSALFGFYNWLCTKTMDAIPESHQIVVKGS